MIVTYLLLQTASLPLTLFLKLVEKIHEQAWEEMYGEENIKRDLMRLQLWLETKEITEEEYNRAEEILLGRLEAAWAAAKQEV
ncbi:MAG: gas vesicle protein GvpG [Bacillota bacterium]|jgi:hypothetical protein